MSAHLFKLAFLISTVAAVWYEASPPIYDWELPEDTKLDGWKQLPLSYTAVEDGTIYANWGWMGEAFIDNGDEEAVYAYLQWRTEVRDPGRHKGDNDRSTYWIQSFA